MKLFVARPQPGDSSVWHALGIPVPFYHWQIRVEVDESRAIDKLPQLSIPSSTTHLMLLITTLELWDPVERAWKLLVLVVMTPLTCQVEFEHSTHFPNF